MRSMARPTDENDMMNSTRATPIAVGPIDWNISTRFRPPSITASSGKCVASLLDRPRGYGAKLRLLTERELHRYRHDHGHRHAVQRGGRELPLPHRVERRLVEQRNRAEHPGIRHAAVRADDGFDDHDTLHARGLRDRGVDRRDVL